MVDREESGVGRHSGRINGQEIHSLPRCSLCQALKTTPTADEVRGTAVTFYVVLAYRRAVHAGN
jgi:hypothetical protein